MAEELYGNALYDHLTNKASGELFPGTLEAMACDKAKEILKRPEEKHPTQHVVAEAGVRFLVKYSTPENRDQMRKDLLSLMDLTSRQYHDYLFSTGTVGRKYGG